MDSAGNTDGIGSRYFTVSNIGHDEDVISTALNDKRLSFSGGNSVYLSGYDSVRVKRGYDDEIDSEEIYPDRKGILRIKIKESDRVEVHFFEDSEESNEAQIVNISALPIGSTLDMNKGVFYWQPPEARLDKIYAPVYYFCIRFILFFRIFVII